MPIAVVCPNAGCGRKYSVPDNAAGRSATCANCGTKIAIPQTAAAAGANPAAAFSFDEDAPASKLTASNRISHLQSDDEEVRPRKRSRGGSAFADFLMFRTMITPWLLIIGFWLVVVVGVLGSLVSAGMIFAASGGESSGIVQGLIVLSGVLWIPLSARVSVELTIMVFRIYQELVDIRQELAVKK